MPLLLLILPYATALAFLFGCKEDIAPTFTDKRDGKEYKIVKIGEQIWMAENLNYEAVGSVCYDNEAENCEKYGRLYIWQTAMKACPKGWHLPDSAEWQMLVDFAGGKEIAGKKLKAAIGWNDYSVWNDKEDKSGNGTDDYGFSALPGGYNFYGGSFFEIGYSGNWWGAIDYGNGCAYYRYIKYNVDYVGEIEYYKTWFRSVRCVRD